MKSFVLLMTLVLGLIGIVDAAYLTTRHYQGDSVVCEIGSESLGTCDDVLTSKYATIGAIPTSLIGALYYLLVFLLLVFYTHTGAPRFLYGAGICTGLGFLVTLWFVYLQLFVLHSICLYCMVSAVTTTLLLILIGALSTVSQSRVPTQHPSV